MAKKFSKSQMEMRKKIEEKQAEEAALRDLAYAAGISVREARKYQRLNERMRKDAEKTQTN